jgi:hypothetical protein
MVDGDHQPCIGTRRVERLGAHAHGADADVLDHLQPDPARNADGHQPRRDIPAEAELRFARMHAMRVGKARSAVVRPEARMPMRWLDPHCQHVVPVRPQLPADIDGKRAEHVGVVADRDAVEEDCGAGVDGVEDEMHPTGREARGQGEGPPIPPFALFDPTPVIEVVRGIGIGQFTRLQQRFLDATRHLGVQPGAVAGADKAWLLVAGETVGDPAARNAHRAQPPGSVQRDAGAHVRPRPVLAIMTPVVSAPGPGQAICFV